MKWTLTHYRCFDTRESSEFCTRHHDAQKYRGQLRELRLLALEARVTILEIEARHHEWQHQAADDLLFSNQCVPVPELEHALKNWRTRYPKKNAPKRTTRSKPVTPTPNATPTTTVTEAQLQALIDQGVAAAMAKAEASRELRELSDSLDGLRKWSLCLALAIAQQLAKSNIADLALCKICSYILRMPKLRTTNTEASSSSHGAH
ncbi:hypothetical protein Tco_0788637 [Tanacetum coccineum]